MKYEKFINGWKVKERISLKKNKSLEKIKDLMEK